ncbi:MAG: hypothetical protein JO332_03730 [Planctomycetaceae bacterium]|nr:hypothetical protein [Planctomycetaceae bacterium]
MADREQDTKPDARGMAGFCAFGGSMIGVASLILTTFYALQNQPLAAGVFLIAGAVAFGLMSNAFFRA